MTVMTGGAALVHSLRRNGVDTMFGLPGVQADHVFDALHEQRDAIRVVHSRHEQGAAYMAYGYAQSTGRLGAYVVVPGPGVTLAEGTRFLVLFPLSLEHSHDHAPKERLNDLRTRGFNRLWQKGEVFEFSTPELVRALARALQIKAWSPSVPVPWLRAAARVVGRDALISRLTDSFVVSRREVTAELEWRPEISATVAMEATGRWFLAARKAGAAA